MEHIVFLDLDGVLISADGQWSSEAMRQLNQLCLETGAAIVLSTSLRYSRSVAEIGQMMVEHGFDAAIPFLGETRDLSPWREAVAQGHGLNGFKKNLSKGEEIGQWLAAHPDTTSWVILDDQPRAIFPYEDRTVVPLDAPNGVFGAQDRMEAMALLQAP